MTHIWIGISKYETYYCLVISHKEGNTLVMDDMLFSLSTRSPPGQNGGYFADDIFKSFSWKKNLVFWLKVLLQIIAKGQIDNKSALGWHRIGNKPLPEPMLTQFSDAYKGH